MLLITYEAQGIICISIRGVTGKAEKSLKLTGVNCAFVAEFFYCEISQLFWNYIHLWNVYNLELCPVLLLSRCFLFLNRLSSVSNMTVVHSNLFSKWKRPCQKQELRLRALYLSKWPIWSYLEIKTVFLCHIQDPMDHLFRTLQLA